MKPINAFTWDDYEARINKMWKPVGVHKLAEGDCQVPVTILPGHLADELRWRKVGEEEPEDESRVVMLTNDTLLAGGVYYSRSDRVVTSLFKYEMKDVDYVVTLSDIAAWVKGVKG